MEKRRQMRWMGGAPLGMSIALACLIVLCAVVFPAVNSFGTGSPPGNTQLHWYGHSAFKLTTPTGKVLLIDPWITNPQNKSGQADLAQIDRADLILITHGHFDHVGDAVTIANQTKAQLVTSLDLGRALVANDGYPKDLFSYATQGNFGGSIALLDNEVTITFVPAVHSSVVATREAQGDSFSDVHYGGNPGGFIITVKNGPTIYHTGDTDLFTDMGLIPQFHKISVMLTCIGDHFTMGPERAAAAVKLVNPAMVIPMHFGTFSALTGTPTAFASALQQQGVKSQLRQMQVGETLNL